MANERLQEAADYYQSLSDAEKYDGMVSYLQRLNVTDSVDVKHSILKIRKYIAAPHTWEYEVARLEEEMLRLCCEHEDIHIRVSISEWAEGLTDDVLKYFTEEYTMAFAIGTKVVRIPLANEKSNLAYGIVRANQLAYITGVDPFDEAGKHDEAVLGLAKLLRVAWYDSNGVFVCESASLPDSLREVSE